MVRIIAQRVPRLINRLDLNQSVFHGRKAPIHWAAAWGAIGAVRVLCDFDAALVAASRLG